MLSNTYTDRAAQMDFDRIFQLIDSVLPFEACLYYQVLPLSVEGSIFKLGIVDPQDESALDYVRRILAYMNWSVVTQQLSSEYQQSMLSAYLAYSNQPKPEKPEVSAPVSATVLTQNSDKSDTISGQGKIATYSTSLNIPVSSNNSVAVSSLSHSIREKIPPTLPVLDLQLFHLYSPVEVLATLAPQQLLQELLGRVLVAGIGRLYFERRESKCRIMCSQDGVLKAVVPDLDVQLFQGVINEMKRFVKLPLMPVGHPKQVELERVYQRNHILLRVRIMPGTFGEEGTIQVLRGAALKFYQQQKLALLGQEALRLAEQLQRKVTQLREHAIGATINNIDALPAIEQLLHNVDQQIAALMSEYNLEQLRLERPDQSHN
jgi:type II secretory ATPase GspE/PulE/Tfp pilus assembly ATPase PilB-like protein